MKRYLAIIVFAIAVTACKKEQAIIENQLSNYSTPRPALSERHFYGCWTESIEEYDPSTDINTMRECNSQPFPTSRYRFTMDLHPQNVCEYLVLAPNDAHFNTTGIWSFNSTNRMLTVLSASGDTVRLIQVKAVGNNIMQFKD